MQTDSFLARLVQKLESDPVEVRKVFLDSIAAATKCQNVALVSGDKKYLLEEGGSFPELAEAMVRSERSRKNSLHFRDIWIFRLHCREQNVGSLVVQKPQVTSVWKTIEMICRVYAFWECSNQIRSVLQTLSHESASLAKEYVRFTEQMNANQVRLQSISKGILRTQEEERAKISRELHDGVGQELTAIKMSLDMLTPIISNQLRGEDVERWNETRTIAEQALQDVRELSRLLRPRMLDDLGLFPTLRWYVRNFTKRLNIRVELLLEGEEEKLNAEIQTILFRVTQESLNNTAKHSRATAVEVHLLCNDGEARLKIHDNGIGFAETKDSSQSGSGISGMRDRVSLYKGSFSIHSAPQKGTRLEIVLPLI